MRKLIALFLVLLLIITCIALPVQAIAPTPRPIPYRSIAGVTQEEITAIEAMRKGGRSFTFGALFSTEAFLHEDGRLDGYSVYLCDLLSELFEIPFTPALYDWDDLYEGMTASTIDFSADFILTPERRQTYFMSEAVAVRSVALFYLEGSQSIGEIAQSRTLVLGFMQDAVHQPQLTAMHDGVFETIYVESLDEVLPALQAGAFDAFVGDNVAAPALDGSEIVTAVYSPLIYNSVALTTSAQELEPIISVFNKYIAGGGQNILSDEYARGMAAYTQCLLRENFTVKEKAYIDRHILNNEAIPVILESGNYPISFYNEASQKYEGIMPDLLAQMTALTGLQFEAINAPEEDWPTVLAKLQSGQAKMISELLHTESRDGLFLWPEEPSCVTHYALLSKSEAPNLDVYQLLGKRIGVEIDTAYEYIAQQWFPDIELRSYSDIDSVFAALDSGEIDLIMASENMLLSQTNYSEKPGYKINLTIDYTAQSKPGFHIDEALLVSIFNKSLSFSNRDNIVRNWVNRVFDYSTQLAKARVNQLLTSTVLLTAFIGLLVIFLAKNNRHRKDLSTLVQARTAQLEEKTAALSTIYQSIPDLLFSKDTDGRFTSCNPSFEAFAGLPESEILGKYPTEIFHHVDGEILEQEHAQDQEIIDADTATVIEQLITYPSGEQRLVETIKTALRQNDVVVGMMGISRDITAHKAAQEAAQAASKAKSSFLARISHEIRTPLNAIIGMAEITKASAGDMDKTMSSVNQIIVSSHHLLRLINDVLDMSKIESGNLDVLSEPFHLREALEETLTMIAPHCNEKSLSFEHNVADVPPAMVIGDKLRLNQVLLNLLSNATKFTEQGGRVKLDVHILDETADRLCLRFAIKDNGIGMSPEQVVRLFRPFEQGDNSIASRFGGTGLGLSISQSLVSRMGGSISIESVAGEGSVFSFELEFKKSDLSESPVPEQRQMPDFSACRILLAEDIEINQIIVEELLSPTGLHIDVAVNGREVVEMFEGSDAGYYQLIFMDIQMPEQNGYEATEQIRSLPRPDGKTIPIVAMTANAYNEDVEKSFAAGMDGHIGKPIDLDILISMLRDYLTPEEN